MVQKYRLNGHIPPTVVSPDLVKDLVSTMEAQGPRLSGNDLQVDGGTTIEIHDGDGKLSINSVDELESSYLPDRSHRLLLTWGERDQGYIHFDFQEPLSSELTIHASGDDAKNKAKRAHHALVNTLKTHSSSHQLLHPSAKDWRPMATILSVVAYLVLEPWKAVTPQTILSNSVFLSLWAYIAAGYLFPRYIFKTRQGVMKEKIIRMGAYGAATIALGILGNFIYEFLRSM